MWYDRLDCSSKTYLFQTVWMKIRNAVWWFYLLLFESKQSIAVGWHWCLAMPWYNHCYTRYYILYLELRRLDLFYNWWDIGLKTTIHFICLQRFLTWLYKKCPCCWKVGIRSEMKFFEGHIFPTNKFASLLLWPQVHNVSYHGRWFMF